MILKNRFPLLRVMLQALKRSLDVAVSRSHGLVRSTDPWSKIMRWMAVLVSCAVMSLPAIAREIDPAERREVPYDARLPGCDDPSVLGEIASNFATRENRFWNSPLRIVGFERVQQVAWRPWGLDFIPRRFCSGVVLVSDGHKRRIDYSVREDLGFIGVGFETQWCITGLDRNYAFAPRCKQARP
jgi:hypothetical protein